MDLYEYYKGTTLILIVPHLLPLNIKFKDNLMNHFSLTRRNNNTSKKSASLNLAIAFCLFLA
jgi:hypothetical protein